jgi:hypothetical protein
MTKRALVLGTAAILTLAACGGDDDGTASSYNEEAVLALFRADWPGLADAELTVKAEPIQRHCTGKWDEQARLDFAFALTLSPGFAEKLRAGCPARAAEVD